MIRFILLVLFVVSFLVFSIPLLIAEWILGFFLPKVKSRSSLAIVNWGFRCCLFICGVSSTVIGEENIPKDRAVLYVANHRSYFDILLTYVLMKSPCGFVSKKEIGKFPLLKHWMVNLHCLFLDRSNIRQGMETILTGIDQLKNGISMFIFPEGTRCKDKDNFLPFHLGSFKLAEKSGAPIVPVAITNSSAIFEDHLPIIKKTHVIIEFGTPIYMEQLDREGKKNLAQFTSDQIRKMYLHNLKLI